MHRRGAGSSVGACLTGTSSSSGGRGAVAAGKPLDAVAEPWIVAQNAAVQCLASLKGEEDSELAVRLLEGSLIPSLTNAVQEVMAPDPDFQAVLRNNAGTLRTLVGIAEEGHMADPGVERLAEKLHVRRLQPRPRGGDVRDAQREPGGVGREGDTVGLGRPQRQRDVARLELIRSAPRRQPGDLAVEPPRPLQVTSGHGGRSRPARRR